MMSETKPGARLRAISLIGLLLALAALAIVWKAYVPADADGMTALIASLRLHAGELPVWQALGGVVLASIAAVPLGIIIVASALLFGPWAATAYVLAGATLGGVLSYGIGNYLGHDGVQRFAGKRLNRISRRLAERGLLSVIVIRLLPIAPFAIVNMIAGASHLRLRDFIPGTLLGMLPGTLIIAFSVNQLRHWLVI